VIIPCPYSKQPVCACGALECGPQRGTALQSSAPNARREAFFRNCEAPRTRGEKSGLKISATAARQDPHRWKSAAPAQFAAMKMVPPRLRRGLGVVGTGQTEPVKPPYPSLSRRGITQSISCTVASRRLMISALRAALSERRGRTRALHCKAVNSCFLSNILRSS